MQLQLQYDFVKSSRKVLLEYCTKISDADFISESSSFGRGSIRNLLVHVGNTYEFWIGKHALALDMNFTEYITVTNAMQATDYFQSIDKLVATFIECFSATCFNDLVINTGGRTVIASPFKLFSHVITHEFHHKGQVLSLSRHLGYTPVDTDIIR
jgi:uncharacterized damage-inducible protein DinB